MNYTAYSAETNYMKSILVSGGGIGNGNAYSEVQVIYKDADMTEIKDVFYEEFGCFENSKPFRKWIGNDIEWGEDDDFKVLNKDEDKYEADENKDDELKLEVQALKKELKKIEEHNKWLLLEHDIACKRGCMLGDGNVGYLEWFGWSKKYIDDKELIEYKKWLGYEEDEDDDNEAGGFP